MQKVLQNQLAILKYFRFSNIDKTTIVIKTLLSDKNSNWVFRFCKTLNINMYYLIFFGLLKVSPPKIENIATHFAALFANLCLDFRENSADEYN